MNSSMMIFKARDATPTHKSNSDTLTKLVLIFIGRLFLFCNKSNIALKNFMNHFRIFMNFHSLPIFRLKRLWPLYMFNIQFQRKKAAQSFCPSPVLNKHIFPYTYWFWHFLVKIANHWPWWLRNLMPKTKTLKI